MEAATGEPSGALGILFGGGPDSRLKGLPVWAIQTRDSPSASVILIENQDLTEKAKTDAALEMISLK